MCIQRTHCIQGKQSERLSSGYALAEPFRRDRWPRKMARWLSLCGSNWLRGKSLARFRVSGLALSEVFLHICCTDAELARVVRRLGMPADSQPTGEEVKF